MMSWFRALHIRERYIRAQHAHLADLEERAHRLEIANRKLHERMELLESSQDRLLARFKGDRGGRPRKTEEQAPLPLEQVPFGDKAALRKALGVVK